MFSIFLLKENYLCGVGNIQRGVILERVFLEGNIEDEHQTAFASKTISHGYLSLFENRRRKWSVNLVTLLLTA